MPVATPARSPDAYRDGGPAVMSRARDAAQERIELLAGDDASLPGRLAALPKDDERGDGADVEPPRRGLVAVGVELRHEDFTLPLPREVVEDRRHHLARTAPVGVAVHHYRHLGIGRDPVHRRIRHGDRPVEQDGALAAPTPRTVLDTSQVHAVQRGAERTWNGRLAAQRGLRAFGSLDAHRTNGLGAYILVSRGGFHHPGSARHRAQV